jgi:hypothetical protein
MSKVLIDCEELENLILDAQDLTYTDVMGRNVDDIYETLDKAINLIDYAKKSTNFSIVEWHDVTVIPHDHEKVLVRFRSKPDEVCVKTAVVHTFENDTLHFPYWGFDDGGNVEDVEEWASLPKR